MAVDDIRRKCVEAFGHGGNTEDASMAIYEYKTFISIDLIPNFILSRGVIVGLRSCQ